MKTSEKTNQYIAEGILLLVAVFLVVLAMRWWPIVLVLFLCIIAAIMRYIFCPTREETGPATQTTNINIGRLTVVNGKTTEMLPFEPSEKEIVKVAFGVLLGRITEALCMKHPLGKWQWVDSNPLQKIKNGEPVFIALRNCEGLSKAEVIVKNLQFQELRYDRIASIEAATTKPDNEKNLILSAKDEKVDKKAINYSRLAYDWVSENIKKIIALAGEVEIDKDNQTLIPAEMLPEPKESWFDVCDVLIEQDPDIKSALANNQGITLQFN